uniref:Uncharacterized protein n=1 Tax=Anopheles maculatus TaxID=74869 RepID=A0A182STT2_9DIPT
MNHSLVFNGASRDGDSNNYWEAAIAFATHLGTFLQALVIPLLLVIGVQFAVQLYNTIRREALRQLQQHVDALYQDRQRLIEEIKLDLLRTLNKGTKEPDAASDASSFVVAAKTSEKKECE